MTRRLTETGTEVVITLTEDQFGQLLVALGIAAGSQIAASRPLFFWLIRLANALNEGNPQWRPYEIPEEYRDASAR